MFSISGGLAVKANAQVNIEIDPTAVKQPKFGGTGFQIDYLYWKDFNRKRGINDIVFDNVIAKRWKELNPGFARIGLYIADWEPQKGVKTWDSDGMQALIKTLELLKETGTEIYLATWNFNPPWISGGNSLNDPGIQDEFARTHADLIEYLVRKKGFTNIHYYCMANELGLGTKTKDRSELMNVFKSQHEKIYNEFQKRGLGQQVKLLATDETSNRSYATVLWALENMDNITGIYGGHHYDPADPGDNNFYPKFLEKMNYNMGFIKNKNKEFILGEFGCMAKNGGTFDCNVREEPEYGLMLAEFVIAGLNSGVYALANWEFFDFYYGEKNLMKWGTFSDVETGFEIFPHYYAYGLMTKYFRPGSTVFGVTTTDPLVRAAAVRSNMSGDYSIAVINRGKGPVTISVKITDETFSKPFEQYIYSVNNVPKTDGNLQKYSKIVQMKNGEFNDTIPADSLVVYADKTQQKLKYIAVHRIDCGASQEYKDQNGNLWETDIKQVKKETWEETAGNTSERGNIPIANTSIPKIYQSEKYGKMNYVFNLENGTYKAVLHFAETYSDIIWSHIRVFDVYIQGKKRLDKVDIFKEAGGRNIALVKEVNDIKVKDRKLNIKFEEFAEEPEINGIEIYLVNRE